MMLVINLKAMIFHNRLSGYFSGQQLTLNWVIRIYN